VRFIKTNRYLNVTGSLLVLLVALFSCNAPVFADADADAGPVEILKTMTDRLQEIIIEKPAVLDDYASMRTIVNELVVPHVDFQVMSRWVLGKHWRTATPEQRDTFVVRFKEVLIKTYLSSLGNSGGDSDYQGQVIRYLPLDNADNENKVIVRSEVEQPNMQPIDVRFRMYRKENDWRIYDVIVEGISMVATNRSSYSAVIRKEGGKTGCQGNTFHCRVCSLLKPVVLRPWLMGRLFLALIKHLDKDIALDKAVAKGCGEFPVGQ